MLNTLQWQLNSTLSQPNQLVEDLNEHWRQTQAGLTRPVDKFNVKFSFAEKKKEWRESLSFPSFDFFSFLLFASLSHINSDREAHLQEEKTGQTWLYRVVLFSCWLALVRLCPHSLHAEIFLLPQPLLSACSSVVSRYRRRLARKNNNDNLYFMSALMFSSSILLAEEREGWPSKLIFFRHCLTRENWDTLRPMLECPRATRAVSLYVRNVLVINFFWWVDIYVPVIFARNSSWSRHEYIRQKKGAKVGQRFDIKHSWPMNAKSFFFLFSLSPCIVSIELNCCDWCFSLFSLILGFRVLSSETFLLKVWLWRWYSIFIVSETTAHSPCCARVPTKRSKYVSSLFCLRFRWITALNERDGRVHAQPLYIVQPNYLANNNKVELSQTTAKW